MPAKSDIAHADGRLADSCPRVLFVDHSADPGGGQLGLLRFLRQLPSGCIHPELVLLSGGQLRPDFEEIVPQLHLFDKTSFSFRRLAFYAGSLKRVLAARRYDLIVVNSLYAAIVYAALRRFHLVNDTKAAYYSRVSMDSLVGIKRFIGMRLIFPAFDAFIANSAWTASCIPEELGKERFIAYPVSGIRSAASARRIEPCAGDVIRIITLSRPDRWKGLDLLVRAVTGLNDRFPLKSIFVDLYGGSFFSDSDYLAELDQLISASKVKVTRRGHIDDVASALEESDIFVLPTMQPEPFGQSVAQALAAGCVVVVPDDGGPLEMVQSRKSGLIFRTGDEHSLRERLVEAIDNPGLSRELSVAASASIGAFDDEATVKMLVTAVNEIVAAGTTTARQGRCRGWSA